MPNPWILGPLLVSGAVTLIAPSGTFEVPELLREAAFIVIGAQVGLRFTPDTLRQVGRLLVPVLVGIAGLIVTCFGLAVLLHLTADVTLADAYLATTPGGFYAVAAVAFGAGADTTFIVAVQGLRVLVMVLLAPTVVRWLARSRAPGVAWRAWTPSALHYAAFTTTPAGGNPAGVVLDAGRHGRRRDAGAGGAAGLLGVGLPDAPARARPLRRALLQPRGRGAVLRARHDRVGGRAGRARRGRRPAGAAHRQRRGPGGHRDRRGRPDGGHADQRRRPTWRSPIRPW